MFISTKHITTEVDCVGFNDPSNGTQGTAIPIVSMMASEQLNSFNPMVSLLESDRLAVLVPDINGRS